MVKYLNKALSILISLALHFSSIYLIYTVATPIINWYLTKMPVRGTDIHLSAFYVNYILKWNEFIRPAGWKYTWFSGQPLYLDYPSLYFFAMSFLTKSFGLIGGVMNFASAALLVFAISSYLLYFELSKNRLVALLLTIATIFHINIYLSLVWAGGIPFWTTQAFLPLVVLLIVKFKNTKNYRWLFSASLATGIGILGHPQGFLIAIFPFVSILFIYFRHTSFFEGLRNLLIYFGLSFLVALHGLPWGIIITMVSGFFDIFKLIFKAFNLNGGITQGGGAIMTQGNSFPLVYTGSLKYIWLGFFVLVLAWTLLMSIEKTRKTRFLNVFPFVFFLSFYLLLLFLFTKGIDFFFGGWYKALWAAPVILSATVAVFWEQTRQMLSKFAKRAVKFRWLLLPFEIGAFASLAFILSPNLVKVIVPTIESASIPSRTHPSFLSEQISKEQRESLAKIVIPQSFDPNDKNKRLYAVDATFNLWWNSLFDMPLARGYIDPPITNDQRWGLFWLDSALGPSSKSSESSLMVDWKVPKEVLFENYKFLLDWNAIYYLAGNWNNVVTNGLALQATEDSLIEKLEQIKWPRKGWSPDVEGYSPLAMFQIMNYYKVKSELVTPIFSANNASSMLLVGDDSAYDTIYRFLGMRNLNSQKVIVASKSKYIDDHSAKELKKFDSVILYRYHYKNGSRAWDLINKYLNEGGKVYIDTGTEVRESQSSNLPQYFPIADTMRGDIGAGWDISEADKQGTSDVDFSKFSQLLYDGKPWNVSYPKTGLRATAKVIFRNNGKVVAAQNEVGQGKIIWTGLNLPYHAIYSNNVEEGKLLEKILSQLTDFSKANSPDYQINWVSPEKREISFSNARSILFKEQAFPTWKAKSEKGKSLQIFRVGPAYPGYMYIPLEEKSGRVILSYNGKWTWWVNWWISIVSILFVLSLILTGGRFTLIPVKTPLTWLKKKTSGWWEKED